MTDVTDESFSFVSAAAATGLVLALWHLVAAPRGFVRENAFELSADLGRDEAGYVLTPEIGLYLPNVVGSR